MKIIGILFSLYLAILAPAAFGQTTINLFDPVAITLSPTTNPFTFGTKTVYLSCSAGATATVSGLDGGNLIVDNDLTLNNTTICPLPDGCFDGTINDPTAHLGEPVENSYNSVSPIDITSSLISGNNAYNFNLVDRGVVYGSSAIQLTTSCAVVYPVCHKNSRPASVGQFQTLYVGSLKAVNAHIQYHSGDYAGPCEVGD